jgi:predicted  nucleic acid-binding Zn-ribbon protein
MKVKEVEAELREHSRTSSTQDGRINVAHARKKKRLDEEFERLLQSIDHKRGIINELDKQGAAKGRSRDDLERQLVDLERQLVEILVEQQKAVLGMVEQGKIADERSRDVVKEIRMPWPPPLEPNANDVNLLLAREESSRFEA